MNTCPKSDVTLCRCSNDGLDMIHGPAASFYPKARLFRVGSVLYNANDTYDVFGRHMWEMFIQNSPGVSVRHVYCYRKLPLYALSFSITMGTGVSMLFEPTVGGVVPSVHIRRIQRAVRCFLLQRAKKRALAVMMGQHGRLGTDSGLAKIFPDILEKIIFM